jgi:hypothetical protein
MLYNVGNMIFGEILFGAALVDVIWMIFFAGRKRG